MTSREALRIQGEDELDLPPLAGDEAVALFCERARAVRPDVDATPAVEQLCERLDRLPLAIELAAARTKLLAPEVLLERLGDHLDLLAGTRDADERHSTLRATISWSFDLLDEDERQLFARLSVFRGGSTLESAEVVCEANLDTLASLADKSLVRRRAGRLGEERYWMLEVIRRFANEQLAASGEAEAIRRRHVERMLEIAQSAHLSEDDDEPFAQRVALEEEQDLKAALDWGAEHDPALALELAVALENFWSARAFEEGSRRIQSLLASGGRFPARLQARALRVLAGAAHQGREWDLADRSYAESLAMFGEIGDERGVASVKTRLAYRAFAKDAALARTLVDESEALAHGRFPLVEAQNAALLAHLALAEGRLDESEAQTRRGRELASRLQWAWWDASALQALAQVSYLRGDFESAEEYLREALELAAAEESTLASLNHLAWLARVARARHDLVRAGTLWGAVAGEGERLAGWEERRAILAGDLLNETADEFASAVARGRSLDVWEATAFALEEAQTVP